MRMLTKAVLALGFVSAIAFVDTSALSNARAQGFYVEGSGLQFGVGRPGYRQRYHDDYAYYGPRHRSYRSNAGPQCPRYYTWQHGRCEPYRGR